MSAARYHEQKSQHQATFKRCWYVNGESYCESESESVEGTASDAAAAVDKPVVSREALMDEFRTADTDGDGLVSQKEFERYKRNYLQVNPDEDPNSFAKFKHFDANRDGYISVEEHEGYYIDRGWL